MKKLITGAIAAAALLFGFASCSNDLHDVENTPYTNTAGAVYILGGISSSTMESAVKSTEADFDSTKSYKVALDSEGKAKFTFTYSGNDSWSAGAGNTAFAIVADVSNGWTSANGKTRWFTSKEGIAVGNEGELKNDTATENAKITGLSAGTQYTVELALTAAGGTMKVTEGLAGVPFELIAIDDKGKLTNALSITAVNATRFSYDIAPEATAKTYKYIARYGNTYFVPSASGSFTVDGATQAAAITTSQPSSVANPLTITIPNKTDSGTVNSYRIFIDLTDSRTGDQKDPNKADYKDWNLSDFGQGPATASVRKIYNAPDGTVKAVNSAFGNYVIEWAEPKSESCDTYNGKPCESKLVYTGTVTVAAGTKNDGWGFGITADIGEWSTKYINAGLDKDAKTTGMTEQDKFYNTTCGAWKYSKDGKVEDNNKISDMSLLSSKKLILTIKADVYKNVYENGSFSNQFDNTSVKVAYKFAD